MTIGIPRTGLYYLYYPFWKTFLEALGFAVVRSPLTDRPILEQGLKVANSETCLPLKIMYGHIVALKDKVDAILLPQMDEAKWGNGGKGTSTYFCPYFVGMPDVMQAEFPELKILRPVMSFHDNEIESAPWQAFAKELNKSAEFALAFKKAQVAQTEFWRLTKEQGKLPSEILDDVKNDPVTGKKIAVLGRPYIIYDSQASLDLIGKIRGRGYKVVTLENLPFADQQKSLNVVEFEEQAHWYLTNQIYAGLIHWAKDNDIAGLIYVVPFNCGPDFLTEEIIMRPMRGHKPMTVISIDESTGEAGVNTRLEAFFDIVK